MSESDDRRKFDIDHDMLVSIHTIVERMESSFSDHQDQDEKRFGSIHKRINALSWCVAIGIGIVLALQFVITVRGGFK